MRVFISRPQKTDVAELHHLFNIVITDAFKQDGIGDDTTGIETEVNKQLSFINKDLQSDGKTLFFLLARTAQQIVGTIAYSEASNLLKKHLDVDLQNVPEITSVQVLPTFQNKGIGSLLFNAILISLLHKNTREVCLDGGYKKSQGYWIKKLGDPNVILENYWGDGLDHMIWYRKMTDLKIVYKFGGV